MTRRCPSLMTNRSRHSLIRSQKLQVHLRLHLMAEATFGVGVAVTLFSSRCREDWTSQLGNLPRWLQRLDKLQQVDVLVPRLNVSEMLPFWLFVLFCEVFRFFPFVGSKTCEQASKVQATVLRIFVIAVRVFLTSLSSDRSSAANRTLQRSELPPQWQLRMQSHLLFAALSPMVVYSHPSMYGCCKSEERSAARLARHWCIFLGLPGVGEKCLQLGPSILRIPGLLSWFGAVTCQILQTGKRYKMGWLCFVFEEVGHKS
ncbi:hypothetical protein KCU59_g155, partial [Aureobasidium melanogenum]